MSIEERLEKLEAELARANRRNRWLLAVVVLGAVGLPVVGLALVRRRTENPPIGQAPGAGNPMKIVRANKFILEDEKGKLRAWLVVTKDGSALGLFDGNGRYRAELYASNGEGGPALTLCDETGKPSAKLGATKDGPALALFDEKGTTRAGLYAFYDDGPGLRLWDAKGERVWGAP